MGSEQIYRLVQTRDLESRAAILCELAEQEKITLPPRVASYLALHFQSNVEVLDGTLHRLLAYLSMTGTPITLDGTREILKMLGGPQKHSATADPYTKSVDSERGTNEANSRRQADLENRSTVLCLLKLADSKKITTVRNQLEVNHRERERDNLSRFDVYGRAVERRIKKQKLG